MTFTETASTKEETVEKARQYQSILVAVDSSDHSNRAAQEAVALADKWGSKITGTHAYAAKMHDLRFRQMEGGLPEQYRAEQELEHQREVHDELITRGLSIITESYLDQVDNLCSQNNIEFQRSSLEGKNYRALVNEANTGEYDLLVLGSLGVGAIEGSRVGTVCERTVRRSLIDTLVIKQPQQELNKGPIVVAIDGSRKSYSALLTAFSLSRLWEVKIKVISTFDPYYHYVAFNRIADVLSNEASQIFKFKEQEKLHEDIIDSGLAKIYQGHLDVSESIASEHGVDIETKLLDGKAYDAIQKYVAAVEPSLLIIGKLGIHADPDLDIGGNAENLLRNVNCSVLLVMQEHQPQLEKIAEATTSWSIEAEQRMLKVPVFARPMARMAILRYAQEQGHTVITESIVDNATDSLMPGHAKNAMQEIVAAADQGELTTGLTEKPMQWSDEAEILLQSVTDTALRRNIKGRAEKKARTEKSWLVDIEHIRSFINDQPITWETEAIARLLRVPAGFMRDAAKKHINDYAHNNNLTGISLADAEKGLAHARLAMEHKIKSGQKPTPEANKCPFTHNRPNDKKTTPTIKWQQGAKALFGHIPEGYFRDMTQTAMENIAAKKGHTTIDTRFVETTLDTFRKGSAKVKENLPWQQSARDGINRAPPMIHGMLVREIETWAIDQNQSEITLELVETIKKQWCQDGKFHLNSVDHGNQ